MDTMRWRYAETNPVMAEVPADTTVEIGDLLFYVDDEARPASYIQTNERLTKAADIQAKLAYKFLGVSMQRKPLGAIGLVRVATSGVFEFPTTEGIYKLGDWVGAAVGSDGTFLENQAVASVPYANLAIGRVVRREPVPADTILIAINSSILCGQILH